MRTTEIQSLAYNTQTGDVYIYVKDEKEKRSLKIINGLNGFVSANKILDKTIFIGTIKKPLYANIFNDDGQELINKFLNP